MKIEISLSSATKSIDDVPTVMTTLDNLPPELERDYKKGYLIMVATRPILGDKVTNGNLVYGRHWVSIDKENAQFESVLKNNLSMKANAVMFLTKEEIAGVALVNNSYADSYLEEELDERFKMLEPFIKKLQEKPWKTLEKLVKEARRKRFVVASSAASSVDYKKGDRVVVNYGTAKEPEYYLGTVTAVRGGNVHILFDDGEKNTFKPTRSLVGLVGKANTKKKMVSEIPAAQIDRWLEVPLKGTSPPRDKKSNDADGKKTANPRGEKKSDYDKFTDVLAYFRAVSPDNHTENLVDTIEYAQKRLDPVTYAQLPIGRIIKTGRSRGDTTAIVVGIKNTISGFRLVSYGERMKKIYTSNRDLKTIAEYENVLKQRQLSLSQYLEISKKALSVAQSVNEGRDDFAEKNRSQEESLELDSYEFANRVREGKVRIKIKWSNTSPTWAQALAVDTNRKAIAIQGSGSKKRWIPFASILDTEIIIS